MELMAKLFMAAAAAVSLWFIVKGLMDMQRVNTADSEVLLVQGVVRQLRPLGRSGEMAVATVNVDDAVVHVECMLPGPWFGRKKRRVTDIVPLYWRRGDTSAVSADTISDGQKMFIIGFAGLALTVLMFMMLM